MLVSHAGTLFIPLQEGLLHWALFGTLNEFQALFHSRSKLINIHEQSLFCSIQSHHYICISNEHFY